MIGKDNQYTCNVLAKLMQNNNIINNISFVLHSLDELHINDKSTGSNIQTVKYTVLHSLLHACLHTHIRKTRTKKSYKNVLSSFIKQTTYSARLRMAVPEFRSHNFQKREHL